MQGYWKSDELLFVSGTTETKGWQATLERYRKHYDSRERMGRLSFSELATRMISIEEAEVTGRFRLDRANDAPTGRFTLRVRKFPEGWRIVRDETLGD
jgi:beta-aspartyl-peptidase (threonine type)